MLERPVSTPWGELASPSGVKASGPDLGKNAAMSNRRTAVVTGASSGIGAATARALHAEGFHVICAARRTERVEALATEISGTAVTCDVTDAASVAELVAVGSVASLNENKHHHHHHHLHHHVKANEAKKYPCTLRLCCTITFMVVGSFFFILFTVVFIFSAPEGAIEVVTGDDY